jgi:hypothetical protein
MVQDREAILQSLQINVGNLEDQLIAHMETVKNEGISNYPILIASQEDFPVEIGVPAQLPEGIWDYRVTTLEELYTKNMVSKEKVDDFRSLYNHKSAHFCVLLINGVHTEFVFIPYLDQKL